MLSLGVLMRLAGDLVKILDSFGVLRALSIGSLYSLAQLFCVIHPLIYLLWGGSGCQAHGHRDFPLRHHWNCASTFLWDGTVCKYCQWCWSKFSFVFLWFQHESNDSNEGGLNCPINPSNFGLYAVILV